MRHDRLLQGGKAWQTPAEGEAWQTLAGGRHVWQSQAGGEVRQTAAGGEASQTPTRQTLNVKMVAEMATARSPLMQPLN